MGLHGSGYAEVSLTVVTGFFAVVMGIPFVLWRVWLSNRDPVAEPDKRMPFADWMSGTFETWQGRMKGANAAVEIILPIAAAAVGMTAFAIIFHIVSHHAGMRAPHRSANASFAPSATKAAGEGAAHPGQHARARDDVVADRGGEQPVADEHHERHRMNTALSSSIRDSGCGFVGAARTAAGRRGRRSTVSD